MKKFLFTALSLILCFSLYSQYNDMNANDVVMVKSDNCYVYKTPQTIENSVADTTLTKLPKGLPIITNGYKNNYYRVKIDGEIGYIFCLNVTTPKRIKELQLELQKPYYINGATEVLNDWQE